MMNKWKEIMAAEEKSHEAAEQLKSEVFRRIADAKPMSGTSIQKGSIRTGTVQFNSLGPGLNLSAHTYFPESQAENVLRKISFCSTVTEIMKRLQEMADTEKIRWDGYSVTLNPHTVQVLRELIREAGYV